MGAGAGIESIGETTTVDTQQALHDWLIKSGEVTTEVATSLAQQLIEREQHDAIISELFSAMKNTKEEEARKEKINKLLSAMAKTVPPVISQKPIYPMYVMSIYNFLASDFDTIPNHEDALKQGLLHEVVEREDEAGQFYVYQYDGENGRRGMPILWPDNNGAVYDNGVEKVFNRSSFSTVSHQWLRPNRNPELAHPDSVEGIKLKSLREYFRSQSMNDDFLWMDFFSIPQLPGSPQQLAAIRSLPTYFMYASKTIVLCKTLEELSDEKHGYMSRGHCLLEMVTSTLPRIDVFGKWYIPGFDSKSEWGETRLLAMEDGMTKKIWWSDFSQAGSPINGNFTYEDDREHIRPLLAAYVELFAFVELLFLAPMRSCASWEEYKEIVAEERQIQIWNTRSNHDTPAQWADWVLPVGFPLLLQQSLGYTLSDKALLLVENARTV